jgi:hypothetical protein
MNEIQLKESITNNKEKLITYMSYYLSTMNEGYIDDIKQTLDTLNNEVKILNQLDEEG